MCSGRVREMGCHDGGTSEQGHASRFGVCGQLSCRYHARRWPAIIESHLGSEEQGWGLRVVTERARRVGGAVGGQGRVGIRKI